jgi:ribonuclease D
MRSAQFLDADGQRRLLRLLRWRDGYARDNDRPRGWILDNDLATQFARTPPADRDALQKQLEAHPKAPRKLGDAIWRALTTPLPDEAEVPDASIGETRDKQRLRKLQDAVSKRAEELGSARRRACLAPLAAGLARRWQLARSPWRVGAVKPSNPASPRCSPRRTSVPLPRPVDFWPYVGR